MQPNSPQFSSPDRYRRGVPFRDMSALASIPVPDLFQMQRDARVLGQNITTVLTALGRHSRAFNFVATYTQAPETLREEAAQASAISLEAMSRLIIARRDWVSWRMDLVARLQELMADRQHLSAEESPRLNQALIEYQMELTDISANLEYVRRQDAATASPEFMARLAPYLRPARRAPEDQAAQTTTDASAGLGVQGAPAGYPEGINDQASGYNASWETQARFFQWGVPLNGNAHVRRFTFPDKSFVDIQAHVPVLTTTYFSDGMVVGASALLAATVPLTFGASVAIGTLATAVGAATRPYDAAWQGYTAHYVAAPKSAAEPTATLWGTRSFYGAALARTPLGRVEIGGEKEPQNFFNLAERPSDFSWSGWHWVNPNPRAPQLDTRPDVCVVSALPSDAPHASQQAQCLISQLATFQTTGATELLVGRRAELNGTFHSLDQLRPTQR